jgi:hypothetical protein
MTRFRARGFYCAYFTEQPYGRVAATETGLPAIASLSACET